jgi:DNA-binding GntR family transcriptional regulator
VARTRDGRNRVGLAYDTLRTEIIGGGLDPGARLKPGEIAERLGVSVQVVREALTRLVGDRIIVSRPHQGFSVMSLSQDDLEHHTEARAQLDVVALRLAVERGDLEWESRVVGALHRLLSTPLRPAGMSVGVSEEYAAADRDFHHHLAAGCGNAVLLDLRDQLSARTRLLIHWAAARQPTRDAVDEHAAIGEAAIARDGDLLASLIVDHYRRTALDLVAAGIVAPH